MLKASRWLGWVLAAAVVILCAYGIRTGLHAVQDSRAIGRVEARAFIAKVRACYRAPKPHPTWDECERQVQDRE